MRAFHLFSSVAVLLLSLTPPGAAQDTDPFKNYDPAPEVPAAEDEAETAAEPTKSELDVFFEELEDIARGTDRRTKMINQLLAEYKAEYRTNEKLLNSREVDRELHDRQLHLAQYHQALTLANMPESSQLQSRTRAVESRIREFRTEKPILARSQEFRTRENAIRQIAMQQRRLGHPTGRQSSLLQIMKQLSASGKVPDIWTPPIPRAHPGETNGAIQSFHFTLRRMLRTQWNDELLGLSRQHWADAFAGQTPLRVKKDIEQLLEQRGVPPKTTNEQDRRWPRGVAPQETPLANLARLFQEFQLNGGSYRSSGSSGSWHTQNGDANIQVQATPVEFTLSISELNQPGRILRIHASNESFELMLLGRFVHRFRQRVALDGTTSVQVTELLGDEVLHFQAATFAELYRKQPRYVEERFFPLLEHLGIVPPPSRFTPAVVDRVVELLSATRQEIQSKFDKLAVHLDDNRFTRRENAFRALHDNLDEYYPCIYLKNQDKTLSREARARLEKLLESGRGKKSAALDSTISALRLLNDKEYLTELVEVVSAEQSDILKAQLENLEMPVSTR